MVNLIQVLTYIVVYLTNIRRQAKLKVFYWLKVGEGQSPEPTIKSR